MVFDDGTTARLAEDHYLMTTTTGNAAAVLDWLEEWRQTEWPELRVWLTSVTDHWATVGVVGPAIPCACRRRSRRARRRASFAFMSCAETERARRRGRGCSGSASPASWPTR